MRTPMYSLAASFLVSSLVAWAAHAGTVKITAINDNYDPNHATEIDVRPGDVITLSADILDENNGFQAESAAVEDFIWTADDSSTDQCDASQSTDCLASSNFQVTDYGVSFYVPYAVGQQIVISVSSNDPSSVDSSGNPTVDTIILANADYNNGSYTPPSQVVTEPSQYNYGSVDPDYALAGQGRWVIIAGTRYWSPYTYVANGDNDWAPYRNGYWSWDNRYGYSWVSYDPWGWMTDHYGIWRNHGVYGWVWLPFSDLHYEPHTVSWFDDDDDRYVGWYPYFPRYAAGYAHGADEGFIDGFWSGYDAARGFGQDGYRWHPGYTVVSYGSFVNGNIVTVYERNPYGNPEVIRVIGNSYGGRRFAPFPGRATDIFGGHDYLRGRCGDVGETETIGWGARGILGPRPINALPDAYRQIPGAFDIHQRYPVGAVLSNEGGRPVFIPPTTNGRGIVMPPRVYDNGQGHWIPVPAQAHNPAQPNQNNPIVNHHPMPQPGAGQNHPPLPIYHPGQPPAPPFHPAPIPVQPHPGPHPGPYPGPNPGPHPVPPLPGPPHPAPNPYPGQPHPNPYPGQPHPNPYPGQPHPNPYPGQPHPNPYPGQPHPNPYPGQPHPNPGPQPHPGQPHPNPGGGGHPHPHHDPA